MQLLLRGAGDLVSGYKEGQNSGSKNPSCYLLHLLIIKQWLALPLSHSETSRRPPTQFRGSLRQKDRHPVPALLRQPLGQRFIRRFPKIGGAPAWESI